MWLSSKCLLFPADHWEWLITWRQFEWVQWYSWLTKRTKHTYPHKSRFIEMMLCQHSARESIPQWSPACRWIDLGVFDCMFDAESTLINPTSSNWSQWISLYLHSEKRHVTQLNESKLIAINKTRPRDRENSRWPIDRKWTNPDESQLDLEEKTIVNDEFDKSESIVMSLAWSLNKQTSLRSTKRNKIDQVKSLNVN